MLVFIKFFICSASHVDPETRELSKWLFNQELLYKYKKPMFNPKTIIGKELIENWQEFEKEFGNKLYKTVYPKRDRE